MKLALPRTLEAQIEREARAAYPRECCGLLEGVRDQEAAGILALHSARNIAPGNDRFEIDPADHIAALKKARGNGHAIIGCYHSHPNGIAVPSDIDRTGAGEQNFLWLIAAVEAKEGAVTLRAFDYSEGEFLPVEGPIGADLVTSSVKLRK
ncbi:MAG TPA: M67 family metallopeptidase [Rhizomicrobium sp.]